MLDGHYLGLIPSVTIYWRGYRNPTALLGRSMKLSINGLKTINFEKKRKTRIWSYFRPSIGPISDRVLSNSRKTIKNKTNATNEISE